MVLADIQEVRKKPSVWEPPRGWSPDLLTDPYLAKLGRFKAPSLWDSYCHHPGSEGWRGGAE